MKIIKFDNDKVLQQALRGKITGERKVELYRLVAEKLAIAPSGENCRDRGLRLEDEAIDVFTEKTKKKVDTSLVIWTREDNENIAISPDGVISKSEAVEVKCLNSENHVEAFLKNKIPREFNCQVLQYFVVNDDLKTLYFIFYDPRLPAKDFFYITVRRSELKEEIEAHYKYQMLVLKEIDEIVTSLTF